MMPETETEADGETSERAESADNRSMKSIPLRDKPTSLAGNDANPDIFERVKALKRKKSACKGVITRTLTDIRVKVNPSSHDYEYVFSALNRYKQEIIALDQEIESLYEDYKILSDEDFCVFLGDNEQYIATVDSNIVEFSEKLIDLAKQKEEGVNQSFIEALKTVNQSSRIEGSQDTEVRAKLPTLQVDIFDGDRSKYQSFIDKFESLVGSKDYISDVDKYGYLLSYLRGRAKRLVEYLPVISSSYKTALDILQRNYVNKEIYPGMSCMTNENEGLCLYFINIWEEESAFCT